MPLASYGVAGMTTFSPGMCAYQLSKNCECCAPRCAPPPAGMRTTIGMLRLAAEHIAELGGAVHQQVAGEQAEVHRHQFGDGAQPAERRPDRRADNDLLGQRRILDALLAELLEEALGDGVGAAVARDILAQNIDALVAPHLLADRLAQRVAVGNRSHDSRHSFLSLRV